MIAPASVTVSVTISLCVLTPASLSQSQFLSFSDQTVAAGLGAAKHGCPTFADELCMMSGGVGVGDFDRDGLPDLFVLGGGAYPDRLYINTGSGTFEDRAADWGVDVHHLGHGVAVGDYDSDGWPDIFVTSMGTSGPGPGHHRLYRNLQGTGFEDVAADAGVKFTSLVHPDGFGAAFGDYDLDGDLDLAVSGWRATPFNSEGNRLFRNDGDGTFSNVTGTAIQFPTQTHGFTPTFCDMDGDRYPELLWVSDFETSRYYINDGQGGFLDATDQAGVGLDENGMGSAVGDLDGDGRLDWYVTSIYGDDKIGTQGGLGNMLYMNLGTHEYRQAAHLVGLDQGGWGWGALLADMDLSGTLDVVETNGFPFTGYEAFPSRLWLNAGNMQFQEVADAVGFLHQREGRALIDVDYDVDGDRDLLLLSHGEGLLLFRNDLETPNDAWLSVRLDTSSRPDLAPDGFGARVLARVGNRQLLRVLEGGGHYLGYALPEAHFGLGAATQVDELIVQWPDGTQTVQQDVDVSQVLVISAP